MARHWFRGRFQASALPLVKLWAVLRSDSHPAGGVGPACRSIRGRIRASTGPLGGLGPLRRRLLPREAGLRRQSRHPRKANTERRSGRGTRVSGVIPSRFCCPAAIKYPAGAVSSLPVESLAVVPPAATGGGGNGSGTERRLVLAVGFPKGCPLWSVFGYFLLIKKVTYSVLRGERNKSRRKAQRCKGVGASGPQRAAHKPAMCKP